jgi:hypothetical protein
MESWSKPWQISGLRAGAHTVSMSCCPIEIGELKQTKAVPDNTTHKCKESSKAVRPLALECDKSQQNIKQQGCPKLPANSMFGVAQKVADFKGLLDLLEEGFDTPAASIKVTDTGWSPVKVICEEDHDGPFAVDLDPGHDTAEALRILSAGLGSYQNDLVVADDIAFGLTQTFAANAVTQVVLGACNPEYTAFSEVEKVSKVNVGLVENGNLTSLQSGAQLQGANIVMMGSFLNDRKGWKEGLQVQSQMHFGGSLSAAVLSPIHAVGHQRDGCRINDMNCPLEATGQATVTAAGTKLRTKRLKVAEDAPKQLFDHIAVAVLVGMGKRITAWCNRSSYRSKLSGMMTQAIANIVQSNRVGQLRKQKTDDMAPWRKGARLLVHPVLTGKFFRQMRRDKFAKLMQCARIVFGRRDCFHSLDSLVGIPRRPTLFFASNNNPQLHPMG